MIVKALRVLFNSRSNAIVHTLAFKTDKSKIKISYLGTRAHIIVNLHKLDVQIMHY